MKNLSWHWWLVVYSSLWKTHFKVTERDLPYGITCHQTQLNVPHFIPSRMTSTRFIYPGEMKCWVDFVGYTPRWFFYHQSTTKLVATWPDRELNPHFFDHKLNTLTIMPCTQPMYRGIFGISVADWGSGMIFSCTQSDTHETVFTAIHTSSGSLPRWKNLRPSWLKKTIPIMVQGLKSNLLLKMS